MPSRLRTTSISKCDNDLTEYRFFSFLKKQQKTPNYLLTEETKWIEFEMLFHSTSKAIATNTNMLIKPHFYANRQIYDVTLNNNIVLTQNGWTIPGKAATDSCSKSVLSRCCIGHSRHTVMFSCLRGTLPLNVLCVCPRWHWNILNWPRHLIF